MVCYSRRLSVLACLAFAIIVCTAPAAAADETLGTNVTVGDETVGVAVDGDDDGTTEPNGTVDDTAGGTTDSNGSTDGGAVSASADLDGGTASIETSAGIDDSGGTVKTSARTAETAVVTAGSISEDAVAVTADGDSEDVDGIETTLTTETVEEPAPVGDVEPDEAVADESRESAGGSGSTAPAETPTDSSSTTPTPVRASGGNDAPSSDPAVPNGASAAAGVLAIAGGVAAARRGVASVATGPAPAGLLDTLAVTVDWVRARLPRLVFPLGYSRYEDSDPLEHEVRAQLYDVVGSTPGIHLSGLEREVQVSLSSVRHHLRILEEESLVESDKIRGKRRYFPAGEVDPALVAALDEPATASVLRTVASLEPATTSKVADHLGRDPSTISHHLSRLAEDGLVERERVGQAVETRLSDRSRRVLDVEADSGLLTPAD